MHEVIKFLITFTQQYVIDSCRFSNFSYRKFRKWKLIVGILRVYLWLQTSTCNAFFTSSRELAFVEWGLFPEWFQNVWAVWRSRCPSHVDQPLVPLPHLIRGDNRRCCAERSGGGEWSQSWPCSVCLLSAMANALLFNDWLFSCGSVHRN